MAASLSLTLAPPTIATNGRRGDSSAAPRKRSSFSRSRPASAGLPSAAIARGSATMDASARCEAPNASFT